MVVHGVLLVGYGLNMESIDVIGVTKKKSMIYTNDVGIKDETIDCSHGDSEVADNQEQH